MTRSELYALVWQLPVRQLGPLLGMSDHGLSKLCSRHDIPVPNRGYWMRVAAGQCIAPTPLPVRTDDETIQRFRTIDARGAPIMGSEAEQWVIPGMLRASSALPAADTEGLRAALANAAAWRNEGPRRKSARTVQSRSPRSPAPPQFLEHGDVSDGRAAAAGAPDSAHHLLAPPYAFDARAAALRAELERAFAAAADHQRHQATLHLLNLVAMRAMEAEPTVARSVLAWVSAMREGLEVDDPLARLIADLRTDQGGGAASRAWWLDA